MYIVHKTDKYEKQFYKLLSAHEQKEVADFEKELTLRPDLGKPLKSHFLREKKIGSKRIYFLIYDEFEAIFMIRISTKKTQQEAIDEILEQLEQYKEYIKQLFSHGRA